MFPGQLPFVVLIQKAVLKYIPAFQWNAVMTIIRRRNKALFKKKVT